MSFTGLPAPRAPTRLAASVTRLSRAMSSTVSVSAAVAASAPSPRVPLTVRFRR